MSEKQDRAVYLQALALLVPSPFEIVDMEGEKLRSERTLERLKDCGFPFECTQEEKTLLKRCRQDAYHAHVMLPPEATQKADRVPAGSYFAVTNPLDCTPGPYCRVEKGTIITEPASSKSGEDGGTLSIQKSHEALLEKLPNRQEDSQEWYEELWKRTRQWFDPETAKFADGPGEYPAISPYKVPGSMFFPDHSAWNHRNIAAALAGVRANGGRPALLYLHVGPVQGFVKASRRTHDLWVSSFSVAFLTFQAAWKVAQLAGPSALVYPDLAALPLAWSKRGWDFKIDENERDSFKGRLTRPCMPNRFVAVVDRARAEELARAASKAVEESFKDMANSVWDALRDPIEKASAKYLEDAARKKEIVENPRELFDRQINDFVEFDAVAQPWPETRESMLEAFRVLAPDFEGFSSKAPKDQTGDGYGQLFNLTHRLLSAHRKTVFPEPLQGAFRPKCVQCGEREQIGPIDKKPKLKEFWSLLSKNIQSGGEQVEKNTRRLSLQIKEGEGLCGVCLTKRFAPEHFFGSSKAKLGLKWGTKDKVNDRHLLRFPSVASVASSPWRRLLGRHMHEPAVGQWLRKIDELHDKHGMDWDPPRNELPGLGRLGSEDLRLKFDGTWFYGRSYDLKTVWNDHYGQLPPKGESLKKVEVKLEEARKWFLRAQEIVGAKPSPYYAVLVMDGDNMGDWLTGRHKDTPTVADAYRGLLLPEERKDGKMWEWKDLPRPLFPALHAELSIRLGGLAVKEIPRLVENVYLGRLVYSGGDDVLALLPVHTALPCAWAIYRALRRSEYLGSKVTASAGIAMCHFLEPLSRAIEEARRAEKTAKDAGRDRFSLKVMKRSGAPLTLTLPWTLPTTSKEGRLLTAEELLALAKPVGGPDLTGDEKQPLKSPNIAYRLEREARILEPGGGADRTTIRAAKAAFKSRLACLLGQRSRFLDALVEYGYSFIEIVDILLIVRFLLREEKGIEAWSLLRELEGKEEEP